MTSTIIIISGSLRVTAVVLFDTGSESSYFHPSLERLGVTRKKKRFVLETISTTRDVDHHGMIQVWYCPFAGRYLASRNRQFPLTRSTVQGMISSFLSTVEELDEEDGLPTVAAYQSSTRPLPPFPREIPVAVAIEPQHLTLSVRSGVVRPRRTLM